MSRPEAPEAADREQMSLLGLGVRGLLMGIAEVVPGVSGGTIAFITGIYHDLVKSLASFGPESLALLTRPRAFALHHNLRFLLTLAAGMALGVVLFARLVNYLLAHHQALVWAFFGGVILMSVWLIGHARAPRALLLWLPPGLVAGLALLWLPQTEASPGMLAILLASSVAVCAWLLPAVSGSYVLLALGVYAPVIAAVAEVNVPVLATVAAGCALGLLLFARLLAWLLRRYAEPLLSFLTGFMLGSVVKLWPWQDSTGVDALARLLTPTQAQLVDASVAGTWTVLICALLGAVAIWALARFSPD